MSIIVNKNNIYNTEIKSYDDFIYKHSIEINKLWDEEIVDAVLDHISDNSDILDIGANIGLITLGILTRAKERKKKISHIHCFECDPKLIPLLTFNISSFDNVSIYPFAISNKQELCQITSHEYNMGCNYIYSTNNSNNKTEYDYSMIHNTSNHIKNSNMFVLGTSLDSIQYQFENKIGIIKIDVEGFEINVLEGAKELIIKHRPIVITEIFEKIHLDEVIEIFKNMGYIKYNKIINKIYCNEDYIFFPN